jgi:hypothetical protein
MTEPVVQLDLRPAGSSGLLTGEVAVHSDQARPNACQAA